MKEFPSDFNIFDYINCDFYTEDKGHSLSIRKKYLVMRNNIFLRLLLEAHFLFLEKDNVLGNLDYLRQPIEFFKNCLCERENDVNIEIDVEVFFLSVMGYKDKAMAIMVKFNDYFKNFTKDFISPQVTDINPKKVFENCDKLSSKRFQDLQHDEIVILRKIINNCALRKFYTGFRYLCPFDTFCWCMTEGRIWKSIAKNMMHCEIM